jgi:hypothetical protein
MATYTSGNAQSTVPVRVIETGTVAVRGVYNANGATVSAGDVLQMVKIPHGARIVDGWVKAAIPVDGAAIAVGDGSSANRYVLSVSASTGPVLARFNAAAGFGVQYSFSDDAAIQFDTIDVTIVSAASATTTCSIELVVIYAMPGAI